MKTRLHSKMTFLQRRPFLWLFAAGMLSSGLSMGFKDEVSWEVVLVAGLSNGEVLMVMGWVFLWTDKGIPLMDEAVLAGTTVTVRRGKVAADFPLTAVRKVTSLTRYNGQRVILLIDRPTRLGQHIFFVPTGCYPWQQPHPLVAELQRRINEARAGG